MMTRYLSAYGVATLVMIAFDVLWIGFIAKPLYQQGIGHLMAQAPYLPAALAFYLLFPVGLMIFAVVPHSALKAGPDGWRGLLTMAALFGLFTYATYDLSNLATLRDWPVSLAAIDMVWGSFISTVSAAAAKWTLDRFA